MNAKDQNQTDNQILDFFFIFDKSKPWERIGMYFVGSLPKTISGYEYILFFCDSLTKFVISSAVFEMITETVINFMEEKIILIFGYPKYLITDLGSAFK